MIKVKTKLKSLFCEIKNFKLNLATYLASLMGLIIVIVATTFMILTSGNMNNLIGEYEASASISKTKTISTLTESIKTDIKKNNLADAQEIIDIYKRENLLSYIYIKKEEETILGKEDEEKKETIKTPLTKESSHSFDEYTIFYATQENNKFEEYKNSFSEEFYKTTLLLILLTGFVASNLFKSIISKPLSDVSDAAKKITAGDFSIKIQKSNFSEINELIYSYNEMAFQLDELYSSLEQKVHERTLALEEANHKLQETQAMMVHSEKMRSLGELVAGIAHEINNPVNFIHGNIMILQNYVADLLKLIDLYEENNANIPETIKKEIEALKKDIDLDFLRDDIKDLIKSCIEGTERTKNIVLDLKNFSRMEEMVLTQFDIPKEIDTTLNILNNKYKNRITVIKNYSPDTPKIEAYGGQLNQVFMNILDNAQDAMPQGGTLTINTFKDKDNVKIEFIDTGSGIPKENLKRIFDPFFTTKAVGKGTGLGMSISYRVINDHNGNIEAESEIGKGTKFTITLPIVHESKDSEIEIKKDLHEEDGAK
ncbi:hypothetical protein IJX73_02695 [bacterium]|nr:hypothetical protein [bacterium]MBQ9149818.1 hypothetical protein [bacterium]